MGALDLALHYAIDLGWKVLPLIPASKKPATARGFLDATTDIKTICAWFAHDAARGVGAACEGFVVLDVDTKNGKQGRASLDALEAENGPLPETWQARTPSGGLHFFFATSREVRRSIGVRPGIDVCGRGGYVALAPTVTDAGAYEWIETDVLAAAPEWLCNLAKPSNASDSAVIVSRGYWGNIMPRAERAARYVDKMPAAVSGSGGHVALWRAALTCVRGFELPREVSLEILMHYNRRCDPPWSRRELEHKLDQAARAQVSSGFIEVRP